jgi:host factor-I protein
MNRKLIRPDLTEIKEQLRETTPKAYRARKPIPPEQTNAESFYYLKQMTNKTRMVIMLKDGEEIRGVIEWYDKAALKVHRVGAPNILLLKDTVKYMYKENEEDGDVD